MSEQGTYKPYAYYELMETSLIVEMFTATYGRVAMVARGAKRPRSELRGLLNAFQLLLVSWAGAGELKTLVRLKLPITAVVISNATYGWIKAGQRAGYGERYFGVDFSATDHAAVARAYGLRAWRVTQPGELAPALQAALAAREPTLVDIVCQPLHEARAPVSEWVA